MSNTTTTPYMSLILPIPGLEPGPQYGLDLNSAFALVDQHTHVAGQGLPIPTAGMNIDADLTFNSFNGVSFRSTRFSNQASPLSLSTDINCISVVNGNMYFNDGLGNQIQITLAGAVNTSGSGNITGMGGTGASVVYTVVNKTFSFYSSANTPAPLLIGPLSIGTNTASPNTITINSPNSLPSSYSMTMPSALPASQAVVTVDNTGQEAFIRPDNVTVAFVNNLLSALFPTGMISAFGSTSVPSGWLYCDGSAVSRTTYSGLFAAIGTAYGAGDGSSTFNVPDLRGQFLRGVSGTSGNDPDASTRTALKSGGNTGNNIGSFEGHAFYTHTHLQDPHTHTQNPHAHNDAGHNHTLAVYSSGAGTGAVNGVTSQTGTTATDTGHASIQNTTATNQSTTATNQNSGGNETRPINVYVYYIIKT